MEEYFKKLVSNVNGKNETTIVDECEDDIREYLEEAQRKILKDNAEYIEKNQKIKKIKDDNPNVRKFIENSEVVELSKQELQAILDIESLQIDLNILEMKAVFQQGAKEVIVFLKKMELL